MLPWKQSRKQGYEKQEARAAKKPGASPQANSGRTWSARGDVRLASPIAPMLIDCKDHSKSKSYRITEDAWTDLKLMANSSPPGRLPMLQLDIGQHRLIVIEESLWDEANARLSEMQK